MDKSERLGVGVAALSIPFYGTLRRLIFLLHEVSKIIQIRYAWKNDTRLLMNGRVSGKGKVLYAQKSF